VIVGRGCGLVALGGGGDAGVIVIDRKNFPRSCVISGRGCGLAGKGSGDACDALRGRGAETHATSGVGDPKNIGHRIWLSKERE